MSQAFNAYINSLTEDTAPDLTEFVPFRSSTGPTTKKSKLWRFGRGQKGSDIASAATLNFDSATGDLVDVTGTTTVTAVTLAEGKGQWVRFTGILTLTHGASLVLPTAANITTAAGDYAYFRGYAAGVVRMVTYQRASGAALAGSGLGGSTGATDNAILRADGTGGATVQNSGALIDDSGFITSGGASPAKQVVIRDLNGNSLGAIYSGVVTVSDSSYALGFASDDTRVNAGPNSSAVVQLAIGNSNIVTINQNGMVTNGKYIEGTEQTAPAAPAANGYRIFAQDNGAGKTQLMVIFNSGAAQQIAIQP